MSSPRGQSGLEAKILASASKIWPRPRPQTFGLGLASISLSYCVIGHFSGKDRVKFGNFVFSVNNLKSYVVNHYLVLFSLLFQRRRRRWVDVRRRSSRVSTATVSTWVGDVTGTRTAATSPTNSSVVCVSSLRENVEDVRRNNVDFDSILGGRQPAKFAENRFCRIYSNFLQLIQQLKIIMCNAVQCRKA